MIQQWTKEGGHPITYLIRYGLRKFLLSHVFDPHTQQEEQEEVRQHAPAIPQEETSNSQDQREEQAKLYCTHVAPCAKRAIYPSQSSMQEPLLYIQSWVTQ